MPTMVRVRVWFGTNRIAEYVSDPDHAARYAKAMQRRFACCRVTEETLPERSTHTRAVTGR